MISINHEPSALDDRFRHLQVFDTEVEVGKQRHYVAGQHVVRALLCSHLFEPKMVNDNLIKESPSLQVLPVTDVNHTPIELVDQNNCQSVSVNFSANIRSLEVLLNLAHKLLPSSVLVVV